MSDKDVCLCPSMSQTSLYSPRVKDVCPKYYQEIGAEMISNQLIIRLEKDKNKRKKKLKEWDPPCECVEIQRPTSRKGPKIVNADYDDRIVFRMHSASHLPGKDDTQTIGFKPQTIGYKIDSCTDRKDSHECKTITVFPQFTSGSQEVYSDHITEGDQDIFLLRIKKKAESLEQTSRNVELEVRTPAPSLLPPPPPLPPPAIYIPVEKVEEKLEPPKKKKHKKEKEK